MQKTILITGCSTGIGRYCAVALHQRGYRVFATARDEKFLQELEELGMEALYLELRDSTSIQACVEEVMKRCEGKLDALFNNAAYGQAGAVEDLRPEVLKEQFDVNVVGTLELTNLILRYMRGQNRGRIIQNSSVLGFVALRYRGAYNASKFALEALSDTLRLELVKTDIELCIIEPGPIRSNFRHNAHQKFLQNIDYKNSFFKEEYVGKLKELESDKDSPFTLGEEAVYEKLLHALEAKKPKTRYKVTTATYILYWAQKFLSDRALDKLLRKIE